MLDETEQMVVAGLKARCPRAARELVRLHYLRVYRLLAMLTCDAHRAEDLAQETFAAAWRHIDGFAQESKLQTWLRRIAYRKFVDECRRSRQQASLVEKAARCRERAGESDPLGRMLTDEQAQWLAESLARLSDSERRVLRARYEEGLSSAQIGQMLGRRAGTIRKQVYVAIRRLRAMGARGSGAVGAHEDGATPRASVRAAP